MDTQQAAWTSAPVQPEKVNAWVGGCLSTSAREKPVREGKVTGGQTVSVAGQCHY